MGAQRRVKVVSAGIIYLFILTMGRKESVKEMRLTHTFFFPFIFISWTLITLQYCSGFCHTLT